MTTIGLDSFATMLATYVRQKLPGVERAALLVRCTRDGNLVAAVFGNDGYGSNPNARREVELVRQQIREAGVQELAFGLSLDGHTWALLVKADTQGLQTETGKLFRTEMLRAALDDAVRGAWQLASGTPTDEAGRPLFQDRN
jgi:hypothetical protein